VVNVTGLSQSYGGPPVFEDVSFDLGRGETLLVLGLNGAGKTSLLRVLSGLVDPATGDVQWGHNVHVGYFAQEHDLLDPDGTLLAHMRAQQPPGSPLTETDLRALLGAFRLSGDKVHQRTGSLSGGEKTKLSLAMSMVGRNNVLLLDEPTNNLDPPSREAVGDALAGWEGSIILVSHDTDFVRTVAPDKVLVLPEGQIDYFSDDWLDVVSLA
jgi:ATPase subunit of ABC transporter with duplicated ATPase domains